jgi:hypothetical protein
LGGALAEANRLVIANVEKLKGGVPGKVQSQVIPTIFEVVIVFEWCRYCVQQRALEKEGIPGLNVV